jgi:hypothetical protein
VWLVRRRVGGVACGQAGRTKRCRGARGSWSGGAWARRTAGASGARAGRAVGAATHAGPALGGQAGRRPWAHEVGGPRPYTN